MSSHLSERRGLERTGRHLCALCLREISSDEYLEGDFYCAECVRKSDEILFPASPEDDGAESAE